MSRQRAALPGLLRAIEEAAPDAGVVLQGSVAAGCERESSDVDLTVVLSGEPSYNALIAESNHWSMIRVEVDGLNVDINWVRVDELAELLRTRGAIDWYVFGDGEVLQDPAGHAQRIRSLIGAFYAEHPELERAWAEQTRRYRAGQELEHARWPDFVRHLRERAGE